MSLVEHARPALLANAEATADYYFAVNGLAPDKKIREHAKAELKRKASEQIDDTKYLELLRTGTERYTAARKLGIAPLAIMRRLRVDQEFADAVRVAEAESLEPAVAKARKLAEQGEKWAILFLLERKSADEYAPPEKKSSVTHNLNQRISISVESDDPIDREILALTRDLMEQKETKALSAGVLDIPEEDIEEM